MAYSSQGLAPLALLLASVLGACGMAPTPVPQASAPSPALQPSANLAPASAPDVQTQGTRVNALLPCLGPGRSPEALVQGSGFKLLDYFGENPALGRAQAPSPWCLLSVQAPGPTDQATASVRRFILGRLGRAPYALAPEEALHTDPDHTSFDADCVAQTQLEAETAAAQPVAVDDLLGPVDPKAGAGQIVAVLDGGLNIDQISVVGSRSFLHTDDPPSPANASVEDAFDCPATPYRDGHGSLVAGLITKLAPESMVMALQTCDGDGRCPTSAVVKALLYLRNRYTEVSDVQVINMSFGGLASGADPLLRAVIKDLAQTLPNTLIVASVGNDRNAAGHLPADLQTQVPTLLGVAAAKRTASPQAENSGWQLASFNTCATLIAAGVEPLAAPGVRLEWTWQGNPRTLSGTSFAAPIVSAIALRWFQSHPDWNAAEVRTQLREGAAEEGDFRMAQLPR